MTGMHPNSRTDDVKEKRILWGVLLAWVPFFFFVSPAIFEISTQKATGLGAVTGGLTFSTFGLAAGVAFEVTAIVLLLRAFSRGHPTRTFLSVISISCSGLTLAILGLYLWFLFRLRPS
jgi:hypothetical protein